MHSSAVLFSLLEILRNNVPGLCVIITSELGVREIDRALLDRIDTIMELKQPSAALRWEYILRKSATLFSNIIDRQAVGELELEASKEVASDVALQDDAVVEEGGETGKKLQKKRVKKVLEREREREIEGELEIAPETYRSFFSVLA